MSFRIFKNIIKLACGKMCNKMDKFTWTKTRPRKPGFYFYKRRSMQVVKIEWRGRDDEPWLHCVSIGQPVDFLDGQWAGPIPEPVKIAAHE